MKRLFAFCIGCSLLLGMPNSASAQFWKSMFKKKAKKEQATSSKTNEQENNIMPKPGPLKRKIDLHYPPSIKKSTYRIDVLVPLNIDELEKSDKRFPEKSIAGIDFYEGVKLATDTLNMFRYHIQVYVHDIVANGTNAEDLIKKHVLDSSDLIIGAVQSHDIPGIAQYAKKRQINFISAYSPSDAGVKDNPYFILPQPTLQVHCKYLMGYIQKKHPKNKMVLCYRNSSSAEQSAYNYITDNDEPAAFKKLMCNTMPVREKLALLFDSAHTNILIVPVFDNAFADTLLKQISIWFPNYDFEVYGMPSWKTLQGLKKPDAFPNMTVYFTSSFYIDPSLHITQSIDKQYRKEYGGKPAELVYRAYETMYWYAYLLNEYGTIFNTQFNDKSACLFTKYDIVPKYDKDMNFLYNENEHIYIYKYQSSSYIVEQ